MNTVEDSFDFNNPASRQCAAVLVAHASGDLTEGQVSALLNLDRVEIRVLMDGMREEAQELWRAHRQDNPPKREGR